MNKDNKQESHQQESHQQESHQQEAHRQEAHHQEAHSPEPHTPTNLDKQDWIFYPLVDSDLFDAEHQPSLADNVSGLISYCQHRPEIVAFNTNGFLKFFIRERKDWNTWTSDPKCGLYVRKSIINFIEKQKLFNGKLHQNKIKEARCTYPKSNLPPPLMSIIPIPKRYTSKEEHTWFHLTSSTEIVLPENEEKQLKEIANYLMDLIFKSTNFQLKITTDQKEKKSEIVFEIRNVKGITEEGYELDISPKTVKISALQPVGIFYGIQSFRQLFPSQFNQPINAQTSSGSPPSSSKMWRVPCFFISDSPRFRWRGMLLDCCRHFMDKEFVKRYIDLLAYHKMNRLHWHLTEDQGWRIEIKKYPKLTQIGAWRDLTGTAHPNVDPGYKYGGYYTQEDIKEVVRYAASRFIIVVPEIEMPGHAVAALAAYPGMSCTGKIDRVATARGVFDDVFCAGNEHVYSFLEDILTEVLELFPSPYIHIGADECPKTRWSKCVKCQAKIKSENLRDEFELQTHFVNRIAKFLASKNRTVIGWDEMLEGGVDKLEPKAILQIWREMKHGKIATEGGHFIISSPVTHCYFDYSVQRIPLLKLLQFDPSPKGIDEKLVLGAECNMWTESTPQNWVDLRVFPRIVAFSEVIWSPKRTYGESETNEFLSRLEVHEQRLESLGVTWTNYNPSPSKTDLGLE